MNHVFHLEVQSASQRFGGWIESMCCHRRIRSLGLSADAQLVHRYSFTSGANDSVGTANVVTNSLAPIGGSVQLEIIVDRDTVEIFGSDGQLYMPMPVSHASGNSLISLTCAGGTATFNALTVSKLKSIWPQP